MVKETGCGFSKSDYRLLINCGIRYIDVAGRGGTSWSLIEHLCRADENSAGIGFQDWGLTTCQTIEQAEGLYDKLFLIAGGGIRSGMDIAKAMVLGARMGSSALPFLKAALESTDSVIKLIKEYEKQFKIAMFLLGIERAQGLIGNKNLRID